MPADAPNLSLITKDRIIEEIEAAGINKGGRADLLDKGFTEAMTLAFLNTAKETNTIVSSRVPGKACTELIEQGYDLKGFQIKAKSCDWGPMAGFICQLPFFNKEGYDKIAYNTKYIMEYLEGIEKFNGTKREIEAINKAQENIRKLFLQDLTLYDKLIQGWNETANIKAIYLQFKKLITHANAENDIKLTTKEQDDIAVALTFEKTKEYLTAEDRKLLADQKFTANNKPLVTTKVRNYIVDNALTPFNGRIATLTTSYKKVELEVGKWSGENTLPGDSPFVQLKRQFTAANGQRATAKEVADAVANLPGVATVEAQLGDDIVSGTAYNEITAPGTQLNNTAATIKVEFLLKRDPLDPLLWMIYHKDISYRSNITKRTEPNEQDVNPLIYKVYQTEDGKEFPKYAGNDIALRKLKIKPADYPESRLRQLHRVLNRTAATPIEYNKKWYYALCGIMNPHPPYPAKTKENQPKDNPYFYRNAVSGDYDLFAFWPSVQLEKSDTDRASEIHLKQNLKLTYPESLFCLDFIPGFKEIAKVESPEIGNINYLGELVAMLLNSHNMALDIRQNREEGPEPNSEVVLKDKNRAVVNRAFHSDEGGRPGILEIEFPIAVFFPAKTKTTALGKAGSETAGGLVSNIADFLQLLLDINYSTDKATSKSTPTKNQFRIILHSDWMIHLFYLTLTKDKQKSLSAETISRLGQQDKLSGKALEDREKEFLKINKHTDENGGYVPAELTEFINKLKALLASSITNNELDRINEQTFDDLRQKFLGYAFSGEQKALVRRREIEGIFNQAYIDQQ